MRKRCIACKKRRALSQYYARDNTKDGLSGTCKLCYRARRRERYRERREEEIKYSAEYAKKNLEAHAANSRRSYRKHRKKRLAAMKAFKSRLVQSDRGYSAARNAMSMAALSNRVPGWAKFRDFLPVYNESARKGANHVVDHIVPLRGRMVCGLHVAYNLRVITRLRNARKANSFDPETYEHEFPRSTSPSNKKRGKRHVPTNDTTRDDK